MMENKTCSSCGLEKDLSCFHFYSMSKDGRAYCCKDCKSKNRKDNRIPSANRRADLIRKYGITLEDYERLFEEQKGKCRICGSEGDGRILRVDHEHSSGKIRGLLCDSCNTGLGKFRDRIDLLDKAKGYLSDTSRFFSPTVSYSPRGLRQSIKLSVEGKPLLEWLHEYNIPISTYRTRRRLGWSVEDAITKPVSQIRKRKERR